MSGWRPFWSYVAWQTPGWLVAVLVAIILHRALGLGAWLVISGVVLYVGKDLLLYPAMRAVFRPPAPSVPLGERAKAIDRLAPSGYVRVNGVLWSARVRAGEIEAGSDVIVRDAEGLTLIVEKL
jgi:membrane protein implicated in regulation of membrane protease activity